MYMRDIRPVTPENGEMIRLRFRAVSEDGAVYRMGLGIPYSTNSDKASKGVCEFCEAAVLKVESLCADEDANGV